MEYTIENLQKDNFIGSQFNKWKTTEEYDFLKNTIINDKPTLPLYLVNVCLFGYFFEELRKNMSEELLEKYPSIIENAEKTPFEKPTVIKEYTGVSVFENEEEYMKANPDVKPINVVGSSEGLIINEVNEIILGNQGSLEPLL